MITSTSLYRAPLLLHADPSLAVAPSATAAQDARGGDPGADGLVSVAQLNVLNLFDTVNDPGFYDGAADPQAYQVKLAKLALTIRDTLRGADIVAVQEVENQRVLDDLLARPELAELGYRSLLVEGNDRRGIDSALLYRGTRVRLDAVSTATPDAPAAMPRAGGSLDPGKLFARPPLVATFALRGAAQAAEGARAITLIVNHFRSKKGEVVPPDGRRVEQARFVAGLVDARRAADPHANVVVIGDLNVLPGEQPMQELTTHPDGSLRLRDTPDGLPAAGRYSYVWGGQKLLLDHVLATPELARSVVDVEIPHINSHRSGDRADPTVPDGASDHDPVLTTFRLPPVAR